MRIKFCCRKKKNREDFFTSFSPIKNQNLRHLRNSSAGHNVEREGSEQKFKNLLMKRINQPGKFSFFRRSFFVTICGER